MCLAVTQGELSKVLEPSQHMSLQLEQPQHIAEASGQTPTAAGLDAAAAETAQAQGDSQGQALRTAPVADGGSGSGGGGGGDAAAVTLSKGLAGLAVGGAVEVKGAGGNDQVSAVRPTQLTPPPDVV